MTDENYGPNPTHMSRSQVESSYFHFCQAVMKCPNPLPNSHYHKCGIRGSLMVNQDFDGNLVVMRADTIYPILVALVESTWGALLPFPTKEISVEVYWRTGTRISNYN